MIGKLSSFAKATKCACDKESNVKTSSKSLLNFKSSAVGISRACVRPSSNILAFECDRKKVYVGDQQNKKGIPRDELMGVPHSPPV